MSNKIAVILNEDDELTSFEAGSALLVFSKDADTWQVVNEIGYSLDITSKISDLRENIRVIILKLEDCKVIIGKTITGLSYNIFERLGFEIFEADSISFELLEGIQNELEAEAGGKINTSEAVPISPSLTSVAGEYFLDLSLLQRKHPEVSSKKALQPFIETTPFYKLDVVCNHIPPWFDVLFPQKKLTYSVENLGSDKLKVSIINKVCSC